MYKNKLTVGLSIVFMMALENNASFSAEQTPVYDPLEINTDEEDDFSTWASKTKCKTKPAPEPEIPVHLLVKEEETPLWQRIYDSIISCYHRSN